MKIIPDRTIALLIHNGKLGLIIEKYLKKWTIEIGWSTFTLEEKDFFPIFNLREEADRGLYTSDEIIERHKTGIINALRKKRKEAVILTKEHPQLRIDVSTTRFAQKNS